MKVIAFFIDVIYWLAIFISPVIIVGFVAFWLYATNKTGLLVSILIAISGLTIGILFAEYVRKKYGLKNFFGGIVSSFDLDKEKRK